MNNKKLKILSFSPYSALWYIAFPEALYLNELIEIADIKQIRCNGIFTKWCSVMGNINIPSDELRDKYCWRCKYNKNELIDKNFNFDTEDLETYLNKDDYTNVLKTMNKITKEEIIDYTLEGIEIGKIAQYEVLLHTKKNIENFDNNEFEKYKACFYNCLITFYCIKELFKTYKPDRVIIYASLYHANNICAHIAKNNNISVYNIHGGLSSYNVFDKLLVGKEHTFKYFKDIKNKWEEFKKVNLNKKDAWLITKHYEQIFFQTKVTNYSSKMEDVFDFYKQFPLAKDKKIVLATLSSEDEISAFEGANVLENKSLFSTQLDWVLWLIKYFTNKNDYYLIIRLHPREFPNKREQNFSESAKIFLKIFKTLPSNIIVNWPSDNINLFLLFLEADLVLNSYSTSGLDAVFFGLPVITHEDSLLDHPNELFYCVSNLNEYTNTIDKALNSGWLFKRIHLLYKWQHIRYNLAEYDLSDSTKFLHKQREEYEINIHKKNRNYFLIQDVVNRKQHLNDGNLIREQIKNDTDTKLDVLNLKDLPQNKDDYSIIVEELKKIYSYFVPHFENTKWAKNINLFLKEYDENNS